MRPTVSSGDIALAAQPATEENVAPLGRLLGPGDRAFLSKRGRLLVSIEEREAGSRRVTHLQRYPEARRVFLPLGGAPTWIALLGAGGGAAAAPTVLLLPPGCGMLIKEGVWHAGPVPLGDARICELLETSGAADRFDRKSVRDLLDAGAIRVLLPEEPGAPSRGPDLAAPNSILLDASLQGRLRLGFLCVEGLEIEADRPALREEIRRVAEGLRSVWGRQANLAEIPGVLATRAAWRHVGIDPDRFPPANETLLAQILADRMPPPADSLREALCLCSLRMGVPLAAYDCWTLGEQILVRTGAPGEGYAAEDRRVVLEGRPALCDERGPFGSPIGDAQRSRTGRATKRALIALLVPPSVGVEAVEELLDGVARTLAEHCQGTAAGRIVVG